MRQALSTGLSALVFWGFLSVCFAAPAAATSVDITLESDPGSSTNTSGIAVTLYNLDTQQSYPGRTALSGLVHFPNVTPGRYQIAIEGKNLAHIEYRSIDGPAFAHTYNTGDMANVPVGTHPIASLGMLRLDLDDAVEDGNKKWFDATMLSVTALRDLHVSALAQLDEIDPKKEQTAFRKLHRDAISECNKTLNPSAGVVWPKFKIRLDPLIGDWTISPIPIKNTEDCGQVFQTGSMTVAEKAGPGHWRGTYAFQWDTSKADPACRFKFSKSGTAAVDLYLDGATVTVKYSNTGQNTFADDTLILKGDVMSGQDATGQVVTYTRK